MFFDTESMAQKDANLRFQEFLEKKKKKKQQKMARIESLPENRKAMDKTNVICPRYLRGFCNMKNCKYAHTIDSVCVLDCIFDQKCIFVGWDENLSVYFNRHPENKICGDIHSEEELSDYYIRVGLS